MGSKPLKRPKKHVFGSGNKWALPPRARQDGGRRDPAVFRIDTGFLSAVARHFQAVLVPRPQK
jgi:hypothetical protein